MKILFISHNNHQKNYFKSIIEHLTYKAKLISSPFYFNIFSNTTIKKQIDINNILKIKFSEIDIKYTNKIHNFLYKSILKIQTPFILSGYIKKIQSYDANVVAFWNGKKYPQNMGAEVTKVLGLQTLYFENGALPDTTAMDFYGLNATASIPKETHFYENYTSKETLNKNLIPRQEEKKRIKKEIDLPKTFIFVPFQVGYDTQIIYHSPWLHTMESLFNLLDALAAQLKIHIIFKEHPSDKKSDYSKLHTSATKNKYIDFANAISTPELIKKAHAIITINSSVGVEALLYKKRVITLGDAFYSIDKITKHASNKNELITILRNLQTWSLDSQLINNFLLYLQEEYLLPKSWKNPNQQHFDTINNKIKRFFNDKTSL